MIAKLPLMLSMVLLCSCSRTPLLESSEGFAQGTTYHISYWASEPVDSDAITQAVAGKLSSIDADMSNYRPDSTIERFNQQQSTDAQVVGAAIVSLVRQARGVGVASDGCYDLTIKPLFDLWGFSAGEFSVPNREAIESVLESIGIDKLKEVDANHLQKSGATLKVDLSSIAQGYSVGQIALVLEEHNIHNYMIEIGGELIVKGSKPDAQAWRVAVEKPLPEQRSIEKVITIDSSASPLAVMTSGTYRHYYDAEGVRYSHILDARTGYPVTHPTVSVTVLYADATLADAWATALLCLGEDRGMEVANQYGIPVLFIEQADSGLIETYSLPLQQLQGVRIE